MRRAWLWAPTLLLLAACAGRGPMRELQSPEQALELAQAEADAGRWGPALDVLAQADRRFPGNAELAQRRLAMTERWEGERQRLEDRLVADRARALFDEIEVLEVLAAAEPDRVWLTVQLNQQRRALQTQREPLLLCAERQLEHELGLAQRCIELAERIREDARSQALAAAVGQRVAALAATARTQALRAAQQRRERLLAAAEKHFAAGDYVAAAAAVAEVLAEVPDDARALALQTRLTGTVTRQADVLNALADRLYAEGQIDAALQVWESSLEVAPAQPDIVERAERARRVQDRLRQLRSIPATEVAPPETGQ